MGAFQFGFWFILEGADEASASFEGFVCREAVFPHTFSGSFSNLVMHIDWAVMEARAVFDDRCDFSGCFQAQVLQPHMALSLSFNL